MVNMILRYLLLISIWSSTLSSDHYAILSGFAWHGREENLDGREYDVFIEGVGYQYRMENVQYTALFINDSNGNFMPSLTFGYTYPFFEHLALGLDVGFAYRSFHYEYSLIPVILPKVEVNFDWIIMNIGYIPRIETDNIDITQTVYVNFGFKL